ncbi:hypothetical protein [Nocardia sp. NPDC051750]|uniref:hypothetical protein n=1 Tax=Nocardia sp. NPDC051750 TaxID=3364325 RepID=UPI0037AD182E
MTPASRPIRVGLDLRKLGPRPNDYPEFAEILSRSEVQPVLLTYPGDDGAVIRVWRNTFKSSELWYSSFASLEDTGRTADSREFWITRKDADGELVQSSHCNFLDYPSLLVAAGILSDEIALEDRHYAAALAAAGMKLGIDVIVTLAPSLDRVDVPENDVVAMVAPKHLAGVFGHYLRMTGSRIPQRVARGKTTISTQHHSLKDVYDWGVISLAPFLTSLAQVASTLQEFQAVQEILSIQARLRRAARSLDELLAALSRTNGHDVKPDDDSLEFASEAFDRELLYLVAVFDSFGRAFARWLDPAAAETRVSLHHRRFYEQYVEPSFPQHPNLGRLRNLQEFSFVCARLRNQIHSVFRPSEAFPSQGYGSSESVAIRLDQEIQDVLTAEQVDALGVWRADLLFGSAVVADLATAGIGFLRMTLEYVELFSKMVMCTVPTDKPNRLPFLGKVTDTGAPLPAPHENEVMYRSLFGWADVS